MLTSFATAKTLGAADTFAAAKLMQKEVSQLISALGELAYDVQVRGALNCAQSESI